MKLYFLLFIILHTTLVFSQEDWVRDSSFIGSKNITDIQFITDDIGFAVGQSIFKTIDGGITWESKATMNAIAIHIIDSLNIWVVGGDTYVGNKGLIFHSVDGGENWNAVDGLIIDSYYYDIFFINSDTGFIVGEKKIINAHSGIFLSTIDGGQTWTQKESPINLSDFGNELNGLRTIYFNNNHGWIVGRGKLILHSDDSGETWTIQNYSGSDASDHKNLESIFFVNENKGFAVGRKSFLSTTDGGNNWSDIESSEYYTSIFFLNEQEGFLTSGESYSRTTDGGATWDKENVCVSLTHIYFLNNESGWIAGHSSTLLSTVDSGNTWDLSNMGMADEFNDIFFIDEQYGWIVGNGGKIFLTQDSSKTWVPIESHTASDLKKVEFINQNVGWIIGECGILMNSIDGGLSWQRTTLNDKKNLSNLFFIDEQTGWIGSDSVLFKTTDGGNVWDSIRTNFIVGDMFFLNEDKGFTFESGRKIAYTVDGGFNWKSINHDYELLLNSIHFSDENHGWICGEVTLQGPFGPRYHSVILSTSDAGNIWTLDIFKNSAELKDIFFIDKNIGYVVSTEGAISKTINGGESWEATFSQDFGYYLNSIYFTNPENGFIVGSKGWVNNKIEPFMLYKTKNGGGNFSWEAEKHLTDTTSFRIPKPSENDLIIYPNPTSNQICISTNLDINEISIVEVSGKTIRIITTEENIINVADLSGGVYLLKVTTPEITITKRFIKQ